MSNSLCGGASFGGSKKNLSKILDLASHSAFVTGDWYIPGHKLIGFRVQPLGPSCAEGGFSKGDEKVENTGMAVLELELGGEEFKSMGFLGVSGKFSGVACGF